MTRETVIAIDGPAGVGKSAVSSRLADALGYLFLDTGAIYRAVTLLALRCGVSPADGARVTSLAQKARISVVPPTVPNGRQYTVLLDGEDVTRDLFTGEVDASVSAVSAHPGVRAAVLPLQREAAQSHAVVAGRDIGTVVLPDAGLKVYLDASPEERAERRLRQLEERGLKADRDTVLREIRRRDRMDSEREVSPLRPAEDAVVIPTDELTLDDEVRMILDLYRERRGGQGRSAP